MGTEAFADLANMNAEYDDEAERRNAMKIVNRELGRMLASGFSGVGQLISFAGGESRVAAVCSDTRAAWSDLVSCTSDEAEVPDTEAIDSARLRFELALAAARTEPCTDAADVCLKILLHRDLVEWTGREDPRVRPFERHLFWEMSGLFLRSGGAPSARRTLKSASIWANKFVAE
jgi:hypothetical protein